MTKKDLIYESLRKYGTCTAKQLSNYIKRTTGEDITPASVGGTLRSFVNIGKVGKSSSGLSTVYWVKKEG